MNVAIIIAGGVGNRMHSATPKQFIEVNGKHVLAHTIDSFQKHSLVDKILVVCIKGWEDVVLADKEKYKFDKLEWIVEGGATGQESIRNGVFYLKDKIDSNDNVIIHDGIRPLVEEDVLVDLIEKCNEYGNAVTSTPYNEQIFIKEDEISTTKYIPRETLRVVATPQCYKYGLLLEKYIEAFDKGIGIYGSSYTNTMMIDLGVKLYFAKGSDRNIKLTTPGDLEIFKAMVKGKKND